MITLGTLNFWKSLRDLDEVIEEWKKHFLSKGRDHTEGFLAGFQEARSPLGRWLREKVLLEVDARKLGAEKALKEFPT